MDKAAVMGEIRDIVGLLRILGALYGTDPNARAQDTGLAETLRDIDQRLSGVYTAIQGS
tara:strand:- start:144 stop:320 length:177 start_codon:yes stop_codon:yes gene_type:complete